MPDQPAAALPWRVKEVEQRQGRQNEWLTRLDSGHGDQAITLSVHEERIENLEGSLQRLTDTVNKGVWALVGFSFTIAASAVGLAIAIGGGPG
jgi:hypothetical protein